MWINGYRAAYPSSTCMVPSVEALSNSVRATSGQVCVSTLSIAAPTVSTQLYTIMLTSTRGGMIAPVPPREPQRGAEVAAEARRVTQRACLDPCPQPRPQCGQRHDVGRLRHREFDICGAVGHHPV